MGRKVGKRVSIFTPEGRMTYDAGDEVPEEYEELIQAEHIWDDEGVTDTAVGPDADGEDIDLESLGYRKLLEIAQARGVEFSGNPRKEDVLEALRPGPGREPVILEKEENEGESEGEEEEFVADEDEG